MPFKDIFRVTVAYRVEPNDGLPFVKVKELGRFDCRDDAESCADEHYDSRVHDTELQGKAKYQVEGRRVPA